MWGNYDIIDLDSDKYVAIYSCSSIMGLYRMQQAWILTRDPLTYGRDSEANKIVELARAAFDKVGKGTKDHFNFDAEFEWTLQGEEHDCFYDDHQIKKRASGGNFHSGYKVPAGLSVWGSTDGKVCMDYINNFRANPSSIPLTQDQKSAGLYIGTPKAALSWDDSLYDLAVEHSVNQANTDTMSHDGF